MEPTTIVDDRLNTADKRKFMTESIVEKYRSTYRNSELAKFIEFTLNPAYVTASQENSSIDGIHYSAKVSQVLSQIFTNAYLLKNPRALPLTHKDITVWKTTDSVHTMGHPLYGMVLLLFIVMIVYYMDSFFGVGVLSLAFFGRYIDWNAAYVLFLNDIGITGLEQVTPSDRDIRVDVIDETSSVPLDEANKDYQEIQQWISEGNTVIDNGE